MVKKVKIDISTTTDRETDITNVEKNISTTTEDVRIETGIENMMIDIEKMIDTDENITIDETMTKWNVDMHDEIEWETTDQEMSVSVMKITEDDERVEEWVVV
jgi:hypothetical protein